MIHSLIQLLFPNNGQSAYVNDLCLWFEDLLTTSRAAEAPITSLDVGFSLIPWDNILSCVVLCVFIVCLFRFMRSLFFKSI